MEQTEQVMEKVRRALGRSAPLTSAPVPPVIDESITRLTRGDAALADLFMKMCEENKMHVARVAPDDLAGGIAEFLWANKAKRLALSAGGILARLGLAGHLRNSGFDVKTWDEMTLDELYDFECGITDVYSAVAETGTLVMRASKEHGRALSLVPMIHIAVVEPSNLIPDLLDLFAKLTREGTGSAVSLVTGPSKTSDIEMNLVVGVHGPMKVQVFLVE
jgi:L-lactate dehydrogenase complex protein LldG